MVASTKKLGLIKFFKSVMVEMKKVSWPNKKELINYTLVVLAMSLITSIGIWIFDTLFRSILTFFL
ncbi:MAG: preprotein translocase subunit SecE [Clostridiales bacterium]|nr:preprotein translocase subunit SecE [Clostridiales bacterium]